MFTVEPPYKSQNDRVYAPIDNKKRYIDPSRLLRMLVMVSVAVSQAGMTELIFVNNQTCRRTLFIHKTICFLRQNWSFFVFCDFPR